ncbi:MAG: rRNA pseudouridine synthase [Acidobacteria bacterium]|nr:rRNA pseudouridine synthase [Acidobacteriota bacterium]
MRCAAIAARASGRRRDRSPSCLRGRRILRTDAPLKRTTPKRSPRRCRQVAHEPASSVPPAGRKLKTLDRVISRFGLGSRTDARKWIGAGRIAVNGTVIRTPDHWVAVDRDTVTLDGKPLRARERTYRLLYKPAGYLTTYKDPEGRPTVYDLIGDVEEFVFPVGRLDRDTSGLLILTNDAELAERLTNPGYKVPKTYLVKTAAVLGEEAIEQLRRGVTLSDGPTLPAVVHRLRNSASSTFLEIVITEGRNRQVRRMIEAVGSRVRKLVRTAIGPVRIGDLQIGAHRRLTGREVQQMRLAARAGGRSRTVVARNDDPD